MSAKEIGTVVFNCLIAAGLLALVAFGKATLEQALAGIAFLLVPSAAPAVYARIREALEGKGDDAPPPRGPSILGLGAVLLGAELVSACTPGESPKAPASVPPCGTLTVDECAAGYGAELVACSSPLVSKTRAESEACEDNVRARYHRPARVHVADGGAS